MSACESCGRAAQITTVSLPAVDFIETYDEISTPFLLCLRCVPADQRHLVEALPGLEDDIHVELTLLEFHRSPNPAPELAGAGR